MTDYEIVEYEIMSLLTIKIISTVLCVSKNTTTSITTGVHIVEPKIGKIPSLSLNAFDIIHVFHKTDQEQKAISQNPF